MVDTLPKESRITSKNSTTKKAAVRHFDKKEGDDIASVISYLSIFNIYITYTVVLCFGLLGELITKIKCIIGLEEDVFDCPKGYAPLLKVLFFKTNTNLRV
jgi:hypothetical protein